MIGIVLFNNRRLFTPNRKGIPRYEAELLGGGRILVSARVKMKTNCYALIDRIDEIDGHIMKNFGPICDFLPRVRAHFAHIAPHVASWHVGEDVLLTWQRAHDHLQEDDSVVAVESWSWDPEGCVDIDDAFTGATDSIEQIHIADVYWWLERLEPEKRKEIVHQASIMGSSIYHPEGRLDMWPTDLAIRFASLRDGKKSPVITYDRRSKTFRRGYVVNRAATYPDEDESHKLVAQMMIEYNSAMAEAGTCIYRATDRGGKGYYCGEASKHDGLGLEKYTHASSPIRRICDFLTQEHFVTGRCYPVVLGELNEQCRKIRTLDFRWKLFELANHAVVVDDVAEVEIRYVWEGDWLRIVSPVEMSIKGREEWRGHLDLKAYVLPNATKLSDIVMIGSSIERGFGLVDYETD